MRAPLGIYVHVPFCAARCDYCDYVTYTATEVRGAARTGFAAQAVAEVAFAAAELRARGVARPVDTVFFGGGTPTLLPPGDLAAVLRAIDEELGLRDSCEVTVEGNPESVDPASLAVLREHGFTRVSLGMQSAREHVLAAMGRTHAASRPVAAAREVRAAGFEHLSVDLIYGHAAETDADWRASLDAALEAEPDHVSAYALTVEPGTRLQADVRRGRVAAPDEDALARRYELADELLGGAGLPWYEVSSWAVDKAARCRHNEGYWAGGDWWGVGPGAHSHVAGERWSNVRHPATWAARLAEGRSPAAEREQLTPAQRRLERILLEVRRVEGLDVASARVDAARAADLAASGLLEPDALAAGRAVLTLRGRQLSDFVTRALC